MQEYHTRQFREPYRSTVMFHDWLADWVNLDGIHILDMACGAGANTYFFAEKHPTSYFVGVDYDPKTIQMCPLGGGNVELERGDWFHLDTKYTHAFDGVISLQTLSWFPDYKEALDKLSALSPEWIAITSLFYEGRITYYIRLEDEEENKTSYYNVYSLPKVKEFFAQRGYKNFVFKKFEIDVDLPRPNTYAMQTYTERMENGSRLQFSGALLMPWYFILATK